MGHGHLALLDVHCVWLLVAGFTWKGRVPLAIIGGLMLAGTLRRSALFGDPSDLYVGLAGGFFLGWWVPTLLGTTLQFAVAIVGLALGCGAVGSCCWIAWKVFQNYSAKN